MDRPLTLWHFRADAVNLAREAQSMGDEQEATRWLLVSKLDDTAVTLLLRLGASGRGWSASECLEQAAIAPLESKCGHAPKRSRGPGKATLALRESILAVFAAFDGPMSPRQVFYQLVSHHGLPNNPEACDRAERVLVAMRRDGSVQHERIVDRTRRVHKLPGWAGVRAAMSALASQYRRDPWNDQPTHVHIGVEKQALEGVFSEVVDQWGAPLYVLRGNASESFVYEWAVEIRRLIALGHNVVVSYFGDHDPTGMDIERDCRARLLGYLPGIDDGAVQWHRAGLLFSDLTEFDISNVPTKRTDSRTRAYLEKFGDHAAELDALPPAILRQRILDSITAHVDVSAWDRVNVIQAAETESLNLVSGRFDAALAAARSAA